MGASGSVYNELFVARCSKQVRYISAKSRGCDMCVLNNVDSVLRTGRRTKQSQAEPSRAEKNRKRQLS